MIEAERKIDGKHIREKKSMSNVLKKERQSGIELLKIIAIIFIVLSHAIPDEDILSHSCAINLNAGTDFTMFILQIMHNLGQIGNDVFLVCSFWFLLDSRSFSTKKIAMLIGDAFVVSVVSLAIFSALGYRFSISYFIQQFLPVTFGNNWFLSFYLLLYLIHPFLNEIIKNRTKKQLASISLTMLIMYSCIYFVLKNKGYNYSHLIGFIVIYFATAYAKLFLKQPVAIKKLAFIIIACSALMLAVNVLSNIIYAKTGIGLYGRWNVFINPLFILMAICALFIALKFKFINRGINYISSLSLLIYITHTNRIIRDYVRFDFFDFVLEKYTYDNLLGWCMLFAVILLAYGIVFSLIYKVLLKKYVDKMSVFILSICSDIWNKILSVLEKAE